jgi:hypothetical protein
MGEREIERKEFETTKKHFNFLSYKKNITSQFGEDGIIEEALRRLGNLSDKQCCEFGAWDGKYLSNTYNLITNQNYEAILIEGDTKKFNELNINFTNKKIIKLNKFVNFTGEDSLDNILGNTHFNLDFDFLSIDIDGLDYYIFESLCKFTPKLICIEFNPTIAKKVNFVQEKNTKISQGSSAKSIIDLGLKKNYFPIASTTCNLFFIHNKFKKFITNSDKFNINELLLDLYDNSLFCSYDGKVFSTKSTSVLKIINLLPFKIIKILLSFNLLMHNPIKYLLKLKYFFEKKFK